VVWESGGGGWNINGRRFASDGSAHGPQFLVDTHTEGNEYRPSVAMDSDGDFVVVWDSRDGSLGSDTSEHSVQGQRFASSGSTQGARFQVNTYTTSSQFHAKVAAVPDGDFVVVWDGLGPMGQRYASDGSAQGVEFQVNTYASGFAAYPSVGLADDGSSVVSWLSDGSPGTDSSGWSIQARRFASDGAGMGSQFQVNTYTPNHQWFPTLAAAPNGDFIVVWFGAEPPTGPVLQIQAQRFAADGSALGTQFRVNTTNGGTYPAVAMTSRYDFVIAWNGYQQGETDTYGLSIQAQLFAQAAAAVPSLSLAPRLALAAALSLFGAWWALRRRSAAGRLDAEKP
jgi:hypothetical protein